MRSSACAHSSPLPRLTVAALAGLDGMRMLVNECMLAVSMNAWACIYQLLQLG